MSMHACHTKWSALTKIDEMVFLYLCVQVYGGRQTDRGET